jgi:hypothetical protein
MSNEKKVRQLVNDPATPSGLRMAAELWLGRRADLVLAGRPEPPLSEFLQEHFDKRATAELPRSLLQGAGDPLAWLRDDPPAVVEDAGDPDLPPELQFLNR